MNHMVRKKLCELIAHYGRSLCDNPLRCEGLLKDSCCGDQREVFVLMCALKEQIPLNLVASQNGVPSEVVLGNLVKRLHAHCALSEDAARWAVESWALALGAITEDELNKKTKKKPIEGMSPQPQRTVFYQSKGIFEDSLFWEQNSRLMFNKLIEATPRPFRTMTQKKLLDAITKRVNPSRIVTEGIILECVKEVTPKPFVMMTLKALEPYKTPSPALTWEGLI